LTLPVTATASAETRTRVGWPLLVVLATLAAVAPVATDLYLPGFPQMGDELGASASGVQLTLTTFLVGLAVGQLVMGPLSDRYGRRPPLVVSTAVCVVAGAVCALAPNVAVLANATDPFTKSFLEQIRLGGQTLRLDIATMMITGPGELDAAFATIKKDATDAVIVQPSLPRMRVADLALKHRVPAIAPTGAFAAVGGLAGYSASQSEMARRTAAIIDKILKGTNRPTCRSSSRPNSSWRSISRPPMRSASTYRPHC